ncbi:hypothetical protein NT6N_23600 [Oceaniferula spumae]|uniref:Uncharacterized protein n=1 Tax=Oceaniferula spumae TaxID=2979115 RepID=A0AAT9FMW0_9BACT
MIGKITANVIFLGILILIERRAQPRRVKQIRTINVFSSTATSDNERYRVG